MKLHIGDTVLVRAGKDKGKTGQIVAVMPDSHRVVVQGVNMYVRHIKPMGGRSGEKIRRERALPVANVSVINEKNQPDRVGYKTLKTGQKVRIFKKTGTEVPEAKNTETKKS